MEQNEHDLLNIIQTLLDEQQPGHLSDGNDKFDKDDDVYGNHSNDHSSLYSEPESSLLSSFENDLSLSHFGFKKRQESANLFLPQRRHENNFGTYSSYLPQSSFNNLDELALAQSDSLSQSSSSLLRVTLPQNEHQQQNVQSQFDRGNLHAAQMNSQLRKRNQNPVPITKRNYQPQNLSPFMLPRERTKSSEKLDLFDPLFSEPAAMSSFMHNGLLLPATTSISSQFDLLQSPNQCFAPIDIRTNCNPESSRSSSATNDVSITTSATSSSSSSSSGYQMDKFESQIHSLANEIQATIQLHMNGLQARKDELLQQLEHIKKTYTDVYNKLETMNSGNDNRSLNFPLPSITFTKPDPALNKAVTSLGFLTTPAFAPYCTASGDGLEVAVPCLNTSFTIITRNCFKEDLLIGRENVVVEIFVSNESIGSRNDPGVSLEMQKSEHFNAVLSSRSSSSSNRTIIPHTLLDHNNGKYTITYTVPVLRNSSDRSNGDKIQINIIINGLPAKGSPFYVPIEQRQRQTWRKLLTFSEKGDLDGQICYPWGVCMIKMPQQLRRKSKEEKRQHLSQQLHSSMNSGFNDNYNEYLIAVVDRRNNRVQLFKLNLRTEETEVIKVIGSPGSRPGEFNKPAGITINSALGHIIVTDKDNHRVQVFNMDGQYIFKFGEKGNKVGQFNYPWDVDTCQSSHQIVVTDTRNRRVQLFSACGQYIAHFSHPLDSPRGVSFLGHDKIVVSDFNKHRLLIYDKFNKDDVGPKHIGFGEGTGWGEFFRPQGICVSNSIIMCADTRNNRVCIYNTVTQGFEYFSDDLNLERPSDVAVCGSILAVVDCGNDRIHICQR